MAGKLIYNASFDSGTRVLSLLDKAGNNIYSCDIPSKPLTLTALADNSSVSLTKTGTLNNTFEVNTGNGWSAYTFGDVINLNEGDQCQWRCSSHPDAQGTSKYVQFVMTGSIAASGNCYSMLSRDFENITSLSAFALYHLFDGCTALTRAPALPATEMARQCYGSLFQNCESLTLPPVMPDGTYLGQSCFWMFRSCSSLTKVFITASGDLTTDEKLGAWLYNASASGDFYANPNTKFLHGSGGIPEDWERWVYGATDTGATTTMYHNGIAESVKVGTSAYGVCYSVQGWAGFKTLAEMHALGYTFGSQTLLTIYHWETPVSAYSCAANAEDSYTENMYDANNGLGFITLSQQNRIGYYLTATTPTPQPLTLIAIEDNSSVELAKRGTLSNTFQIDVGSGWQSYTFGDVINLNRGDSIKWRCSAHPDTQSISNYVIFNMTGLIKASGNCNSMLDGTNFDSMTSLVGYDYAFYQLFAATTALTQAPELPAITLANSCYSRMFFNCRLLTEVRIAATTTATDALHYWLVGVADSGTVYADPSFTDLPADSKSGIPQNWVRANINDYPTT